MILLCMIRSAGGDISAQQAEGCYSSSGGRISCGSSWVEYRNGVKYNCRCDCNKIPPANCVPAASGGPSNGNIKSDRVLNGLGEINNLLNKLDEKPVPEKKAEQPKDESNKANENAEFENTLKSMKKIPDQSNKQGIKLKEISEPGTSGDPGFKPIPLMGSSPLTADERERMRAYNLKPVQDNRLDESDFKLEESPFWTTPEMIKLGTDALKFSLGFVSGGYVAVAGVDVVSGILNKESGQQIVYKVAEDLAIKKVGDFVGNGVLSGKVAIRGIGFKTGVFSGAGAKQDLEFAFQGADMAKDAWTGIKEGGK